MHLFSYRPAPNRPARARSRSRLLAVLIVAVMFCTAGVAAGATQQESSPDPSTAQIFAFFYPGSPAPRGPAADALASEMYAEAVWGSRAMDWVPRPLAGPVRSWRPMVNQFVRIADRVLADENRIYEYVRAAISWGYVTRFNIMLTVDAPEPIVDVGPPTMVPPPVQVTIAPPPSGSGGGGAGGGGGGGGIGGRSYDFLGSSFGGGSRGGIVTVGPVIQQQK